MPSRDSFDATAHRRLLGEAIARTRGSKGWTQEDLAEHAGLHRTYVSQVERGHRAASIDVIWRVAVALDVPVADLVANLIPPPGRTHSP